MAVSKAKVLLKCRRHINLDERRSSALFRLFWKTVLRSRVFLHLKNDNREDSQDGSKIGGSRAHFPLHIGEAPSPSTEEQSEQPIVPQSL